MSNLTRIIVTIISSGLIGLITSVVTVNIYKNYLFEKEIDKTKIYSNTTNSQLNQSTFQDQPCPPPPSPASSPQVSAIPQGSLYPQPQASIPTPQRSTIPQGSQTQELSVTSGNNREIYRSQVEQALSKADRLLFNGNPPINEVIVLSEELSSLYRIKGLSAEQNDRLKLMIQKLRKFVPPDESKQYDKKVAGFVKLSNNYVLYDKALDINLKTNLYFLLSMQLNDKQRKEIITSINKVHKIYINYIIDFAKKSDKIKASHILKEALSMRYLSGDLRADIENQISLLEIRDKEK